MMLARSLERWGLEVVVAHDGEEAWRIIDQDGGIAMAILDWMMPGADGPELCRRIRQDERHAHMHVILLTARDSRADVVAGLDAGADDYLIKPFDPDELRARVHVGIRVLALQDRLAERVAELQEALSKVKQLSGLLPICSYCKRIRGDENYWEQVESYITRAHGREVQPRDLPAVLRHGSGGVRRPLDRIGDGRGFAVNEQDRQDRQLDDSSGDRTTNSSTSAGNFHPLAASSRSSRTASACETRGLVRPFGGQGVVAVHDVHDPGEQRDTVALEAVRISRPIRPLVVMPDDGTHVFERSQLAAQPMADDRMLLHHRPLRGVRRPGFSSMTSGMPTLPTSCRNAPRSKRDELVVVEPETRAERRGVARETFTVPLRATDRATRSSTRESG